MTPEEFAHEFGPEFTTPQTHTIDPTPYGHNPHTKPVKTGLTPRGKAAIAIGATVIAGGSLLGWQHYSAQQADAQAKAQEIALKQQELRLEELKEMNKEQAANAKVQSTADAARQKQIDTCVMDNKGLVGKQLGATLGSVINDCKAQYPAATGSADMQNAADAQSTSGSGGGVSTGLLVGGAVLAGGVVLVARKNTRSNQT